GLPIRVDPIGDEASPLGFELQNFQEALETSHGSWIRNELCPLTDDQTVEIKAALHVLEVAGHFATFDGDGRNGGGPFLSEVVLFATLHSVSSQRVRSPSFRTESDLKSLIERKARSAAPLIHEAIEADVDRQNRC